MFFKAIDKFFDEIRNVISAIIFAFIAMSILLFIYWIFYVAKLTMPVWLNSFVWGIIDFLTQWHGDRKSLSEITDILPVLASVFFGFLTYLANCLLLFLEDHHKKYKESVENYKLQLEKTINRELHKDFLKELKKTSFMLVKIKIVVEKQSSYLTVSTDKTLDSRSTEKEIENCILAAVKGNKLQTKGKTEDSVYFLLSDFTGSKDFFSELVTNSTQLIKSYLQPKTAISFYCGAELFNDISEFEEKSAYLDNVISLKIPNKIVITPRYKLYFDNIYPSMYEFNVLGEYNLSPEDITSKNTMLYSLKRK